MPSVRVKRGYTSLRDSKQDPYAAFTPRPRNDSILSGAVPSDTAREAKYSGRERASSTSQSNHNGPPMRLPYIQRPNKISRHVMGCSRTARVGPNATMCTSFGQTFAIAEGDRNPFSPSPEMARRATAYSHSLLERHREQEEVMISLEGPQTEVLVPRDVYEPGRLGSALSISRSLESQYDWDGEHHPDDIVEHLDVIDLHIATVATLTNAANAIVIPPLDFYSRKPVVVLSRKRRSRADAAEKGKTRQDDENSLDYHVEDVLRKRDRFRRVMQGVWSFVKTPLGVVTAIYGFLVVFWGTALVFFLARFIDLHNDNTQYFWVEICQQIETSLFSLTSIGLAPFRIVDTYRVCKILYYKRKAQKLRRKACLPELYDPSDLPDPRYDVNYVPVLTEREQIDLHYQQHKFMHSQTWYRPHGTQTHRAFPIDITVWICVMNDLNTIFQCLLSGCMWSMNRFVRPAWTTATTLPLAFIAGIVAGVLIWWGGKKTKRVKEVTERLRMALAMERPVSDGQPDRPLISETGEHTSRIPEVKPQLDSGSLPSDGQKPQCKDFAEEGKEGSGETQEPSPVTPITFGIQIVDEMMVPSADALAEKS